MHYSCGFRQLISPVRSLSIILGLQSTGIDSKHNLKMSFKRNIDKATSFLAVYRGDQTQDGRLGIVAASKGAGGGRQLLEDVNYAS
jgi:hypothetical protein